eukprot:m.313581 g.313581  ORF g.313581 m.313581 type:complete len:60 (-) comp16491_c6_seq2:443-622(-)
MKKGEKRENKKRNKNSYIDAESGKGSNTLVWSVVMLFCDKSSEMTWVRAAKTFSLSRVS